MHREDNNGRKQKKFSHSLGNSLYREKVNLTTKSETKNSSTSEQTSVATRIKKDKQKIFKRSGTLKE